MRKKDKKQLLDLIKTVEAANQMLMSMLERQSFQEMEALLANEQEAALSIGNRIEQLEGEGTEAVAILEEYCEVLWEITQADSIEKKRAGIQRLTVLLEEERHALEKIHTTLDVVFLPYKASMWDCMETIWKAANEDEDCNAYVIPIPYFDLQSDGSVGEAHYEADLFPDYVPIVSYKDYDLKKEKPDIVYIHNPYDNYNRVTSVHPDFYSTVLKENTNMLVYVPYFSTGSGMPETHRFFPSYQNVDRIIVESEQMAKDIDEQIPREKLLICGSPKVERILWMEAHKEQVSFPEEWKRKAQGKKVVFYNISITGLLHSGEKALDKMEEVFQIASENEKILLLWRPHPLLEATLKSMRPELQERYRRLMRWFKKKSIGILDNTADPDLAVVFADAYIGENSSSIVDLFRAADKPRLFLTKERYYQPTLDEMRAERTYDVCLIGQEMWFVTTELQLLCRCDMGSKRVTVVAELPEVPHSGWLRYVSLVSYENKILLVPRRSDAVCVYNRDTGTFIKYYFNEEFIVDCFGGVALHAHYLFLAPLDYPAIVRFDILTGEFTYFSECISEILQQVESPKLRSAFIWTVSCYGDEFFFASSWSNHVLRFNMETLEWHVFRVGAQENMWRGITSDAENSWLIVYDSPKVVRWNRKTGETEEYVQFPDGFTAGDLSWKNVISCSQSVYMLAFQANHSCKLNKETGVITYADFGLPYSEDSFASPFYERAGGAFDFGKKLSESKIMAFSLYDDSFALLDVDEKTCERIPLRIENRLFWNMKKKHENVKQLTESNDYTLSEFLEGVARDLFSKNIRYSGWKMAAREEDCVGERVHRQIKMELTEESRIL